MIIATFILIMSIVTLVKGNIFYDTSVAMYQSSIDTIDGKKPDGKAATSIVFVWLFVMIYLVLQIITMYSATGIESLRQPSLIMLGITLFNFMWTLATSKSAKGTDEQKRAKHVRDRDNVRHRTFKGTVMSLLWTVYSAAIIYVSLGGSL